MSVKILSTLSLALMMNSTMPSASLLKRALSCSKSQLARHNVGSFESNLKLDNYFGSQNMLEYVSITYLSKTSSSARRLNFFTSCCLCLTSVNIENIRELRFGADARGFREQLKMASDCEPRWITLIYTSSGRYKILHLVALTTDDFKLWRQTLQLLYDQRKELMGGLDQMRKRQAVWLKQHWSSADINEDHKLDIGDVEQLCRNLNISASPQAIRTNFEVGFDSTLTHIPA